MTILMTLTSLLLLSHQGPADKDKDRQLLQGKWEIVTIVSRAGKEELKPGQMQAIFAGDKIISKEGPKSWEATFTLDSSKMPRTIDLRTVAAEDKAKIYHGIYEWNGSELKMCLGAVNAVRPTEFTPLTNQSLIIMRRMKE